MIPWLMTLAVAPTNAEAPNAIHTNAVAVKAKCPVGLYLLIGSFRSTRINLIH